MTPEERRRVEADMDELVRRGHAEYRVVNGEKEYRLTDKGTEHIKSVIRELAGK